MNIENEKFNEIKQFVQGRYVAASEAAWRIFRFSIQGHSPTVCRLAVHLQDKQPVTYNLNDSSDIDHSIDSCNDSDFTTIFSPDSSNYTQNKTENNLQKLSKIQKQINKILEKNWSTTLMAWFELNKNDEFARQFLYKDIPKYYFFAKKEKKWIKRKKPSILTVGRVYAVHANDTERFALRVLLHHVRGANSFNDLKIVDGAQYPSFHSAAVARGLLADHLESIKCLEEAYLLLANPNAFRKFFCQYIINCTPDVGTLWLHFKQKLSEDILYNQKIAQNNQDLDYYEDIYKLCLIKIKILLQSENTDISNFDLPQLNNKTINDLLRRYNEQIVPFNNLVFEEANRIYNENYPKLNLEQKKFFETVI
jgi:hypothetical protein